MLNRRFVLAGLVAAPAVVSISNIMPVRSIIQRYATVWGVGHDLDVIEHVVWSQEEAAAFARPRGPIDKFREVTDVVYNFDMPSLPRNPFNGYPTWTPTQPHKSMTTPVVKDDGFTSITTFGHLRDFRESQRPDLGNILSKEWVQNEIRLQREAGYDPFAPWHEIKRNFS
jgi:hypothetical protein